MTTATVRDTHRSAVYRTESLIRAMFDRPGMVEIAGSTVHLSGDARFGSVEAVQTYVDKVLALSTVRDRWPTRASLPVSVRERKGAAHAHYSPTRREIAVPAGRSDGTWAMRELVVLHEIAHHLNTVRPAHGPEFVQTFTELAGMVLGAEAGLIFTVMFSDR